MSADQIANRFAQETAGHQLTILHDDGLYRHLRMMNPEYGGLYAYSLITWPNGLAFRGDGPNFIFTMHPTGDVFEMFRRSNSGGINPGYWQEKVQAGPVKAWSARKFREWLTAQADEAEVAYPGIVGAVHAEVFEGDWYSVDLEENARATLAEFEHKGHQFRYPAKWVQDFDDWSWEYLWACHAIVAGIAQYDQAKATAPKPRPCSFAERQVCAPWLQEHGDYADWSPETHAAYERAIHAMAVAS